MAARNFDLHGARRARAEARGDVTPDTVTLVDGGKAWPLPVEVPYGALEGLGGLLTESPDGKPAVKFTPETVPAVTGLLASLLGDDAMAEFRAQDPSIDDWQEVFLFVLEAAGMSAGESSAS